MGVITFPKNLLSILLHEVISLPDPKSYDNVNTYISKGQSDFIISQVLFQPTLASEFTVYIDPCILRNLKTAN